MERDEVIRMAREAGAYLQMRLDGVDTYQIGGNASIARFAALVEAAATEKANERANASWSSMCEKMVAAEREARHAGDPVTFYTAVGQCAKAIRARGES